MSEPTTKSGTNPYLIAALVLVVIALGFLVYTSTLGSSLTGEYKAVFLTNSQVYFGKVTDTADGYLTLTNVFYPKDPAVLSGASAGGEIALVKLGKELHGPTDSIQINQDQILSIETLSDSSKVLAAIQQYQAGR